MSKVKLETKTNTIIKNSLLKYYSGGYFKKIPDPGMVGFGQNRFTPPRGIDIIYYWQSMMVGIESKAFHNKNRFIFSSVSDLQIEELYTIAMNNGNAWIAINVFEPRVINRIYFIDIFDFMHWRETSKTKSVNSNLININPHISFYLDVSKQLINLEDSLIIGW